MLSVGGLEETTNSLSFSFFFSFCSFCFFFLFFLLFFFRAGKITDFDGQWGGGKGAPNNGKVNVDYDGRSKYKGQSRDNVYPCSSAGYGWSSSTRLAECNKPCARSSELCPVQLPDAPDLSSPACRDLKKIGNRKVCNFEERDWDRYGPRKYFCSEPGRVGAWCGSNDHCGNNAYCWLARCNAKKPSKTHNQLIGHVCTAGYMCQSNICSWTGAVLNCLECTKHQGCNSNQFCHYGICKQLRGPGWDCNNNAECNTKYSNSCEHISSGKKVSCF